MRKTKKSTTIALLCLLLLGGRLSAQNNDNKIAIAVLPFLSKSGKNISNKLPVITDMVTAEFIGKQRFAIIEREKFGTLKTEVSIQGDPMYIMSNVINQGRQTSAKYFLTGNIVEYGTKKETVSNFGNINYSNNQGGTHLEDRFFLVMSFQMTDIETGATTKSIPISVENAIDENTLMCNARKEVRKAIRSLFPIELKIIKVEKTTKKGLPDQVLITGGEEIFGGKNSNEKCGGSGGGLSLPWPTGPGAAVMQVYTEEKGDGYTRKSPVGEIKLDHTEGDVAVCDVKKGAQEIQNKLNEGKKLLLEIIKN